MSRAGLLLLTAQIALAASVVATYGMLPDQVATHFSSDGRASGWTSRPTYAAIIILGGAATALACAGPIYLARHLPDSLINIPHRDYWLAPERRRETYERLAELGTWTGILTTALFLGLHLLTVRAHRVQPPRLPLTDGLSVIGPFLIGLAAVVYVYGFRAWRVDDAR